jgi:hypothetical protein
MQFPDGTAFQEVWKIQVDGSLRELRFKILPFRSPNDHAQTMAIQDLGSWNQIRGLTDEHTQSLIDRDVGEWHTKMLPINLSRGLGGLPIEANVVSLRLLTSPLHT